MFTDLLALSFFIGWTCLLWRLARRVDSALRAAAGFRADQFLAEVRRAPL